MRISIFGKLFASLFVTCSLLILTMTLFIGHSFRSGFQGYLNEQEKTDISKMASVLAEEYARHNSWEPYRHGPKAWSGVFLRLHMPLPPIEPPEHNLYSPMEMPPRQEFDMRPEFTQFSPISHRIYLMNHEENWVAGVSVEELANRGEKETQKHPVKIEDEVIGWLVFKQKDMISGPLVTQFYMQQKENMFWIIMLAALASFVMALLLVRLFLAPLKRLKEGAGALSKGDYSVSIETDSKDEFGDLAESFQVLVASLKRQKESREQWLVDISHELRTPISVLRSELEAIQDGIRKADETRIDSMHQQVMGLRHLVDDLYLLSKTDSGVLEVNRRSLDLGELSKTLINAFEPKATQKGLELSLLIDTGNVLIRGDEKALRQLLMNLLENSLRYTDAPGKIDVSVTAEDNDVVLRVSDSSPSVSEEHLPKLFRRLYRVDASRSRQYGGSGLGLSICKSLVAAHGGNIVAEVSSLGGLMIEVRLQREAV